MPGSSRKWMVSGASNLWPGKRKMKTVTKQSQRETRLKSDDLPSFSNCCKMRTISWASRLVTLAVFSAWGSKFKSFQVIESRRNIECNQHNAIKIESSQITSREHRFLSVKRASRWDTFATCWPSSRLTPSGHQNVIRIQANGGGKQQVWWMWVTSNM